MLAETLDAYTALSHADRPRAAMVVLLTIATPGAGSVQPLAPPRDITGFFHEIRGEWIGTVDHYTDGVKADTMYFHAVAKQTSPETYESVFEYFRIDFETRLPVQTAVTNMTTTVTPEGSATNTVAGKGGCLPQSRYLKA